MTRRGWGGHVRQIIDAILRDPEDKTTISLLFANQVLPSPSLLPLPPISPLPRLSLPHTGPVP